jgi:hypothetical protein
MGKEQKTFSGVGVGWDAFERAGTTRRLGRRQFIVLNRLSIPYPSNPIHQSLGNASMPSIPGTRQKKSVLGYVRGSRMTILCVATTTTTKRRCKVCQQQRSRMYNQEREGSADRPIASRDRLHWGARARTIWPKKRTCDNPTIAREVMYAHEYRTVGKRSE